MKQLFTICLLFVSTLYAYSQNAVLEFEYIPNKYLEKDLFKSGVTIILHREDKNSEYGWERVYDTTLLNGNTKIYIDTLKEGRYRLVLMCQINMSEDKKWILNYHLPSKMVDNIMLKNSVAYSRKTDYPDPCEYYQHFHDNKCPKCNKSDKTVRIGRGGVVADPLDNPPKTYHDSQESTGCDPSWYCERDNFKF